MFIASVIYTQAYNQALASQQQQAAQLIAANSSVAAANGLAGMGLLGLAAQKEGGFFRSITSIHIPLSLHASIFGLLLLVQLT